MAMIIVMFRIKRTFYDPVRSIRSHLDLGQAPEVGPQLMLRILQSRYTCSLCLLSHFLSPHIIYLTP